jgi:hypothetical protein
MKALYGFGRHAVAFGALCRGAAGSAAAKPRAFTLLKQWLSPERRAGYERYRYFDRQRYGHALADAPRHPNQHRGTKQRGATCLQMVLHSGGRPRRGRCDAGAEDRPRNKRARRALRGSSLVPVILRQTGRSQVAVKLIADRYYHAADYDNSASSGSWRRIRSDATRSRIGAQN